MDLADKNVLIIGKGLSGIHSALFVKENGGNPYIYDDFDHSPCEIKQISYTEVIRQLPRFDFGVISPGVSWDNRLVKTLKANKFLIISELDFAYLQSCSKIIAVTGTNGKTTVVSLTAKLLSDTGYKAVAVGNIGVPFILWSKWLKSDDVAVVEVSSFQLEQSDCFAADIVTITNISEDHLDRHKSMDAYKAIKLKLLKKVKKQVVINADHEKYPTSHKKFTYSMLSESADVFVSEGAIYFNDGAKKNHIIDLDELRVKGDHNISNVLCSLSLALSHTGQLVDTFCDTLREFELEKYRIECMGKVRGINVYNDSKGTNMGATLCAIKAMKGKTLLIMGGYDKLDDYSGFFESLEDKVVAIHFCGANSVSVLSGAVSANKQHLIKMYDNLASAVEAAFGREGFDNLLFSPATSSFDAYFDYKQRGRAFEEIIHNIRKSH